MRNTNLFQSILLSAFFCISALNLKAQCTASFTYNNTGYTYNFQNTSTGSNLTYYWYFGDANTSTAQNPSHTYTAGTYNVYLIISNGSCSDTTFRTINASSTTSCMAYFGQSNTQNVYTFTNYSQGSSTGYTWFFGDGTTSATQNPVHTYTTSGTYDVCLTIYSSYGCQDTFCRTLTVTVPSGCQAYFYSNNSQNIYTFHDTSTGTNLNYSWNFGDGSTASGRVVTHTFTTSGTYNVCDIISNTSIGCLDTFCKSITVTVPASCLSYFGYTNSQNVYTFTNYSQGSNLSYNWNFGDGNTATDQTPAPHTYGTSGTYNVCLIISNTSGCLDTFCRSIAVTVPTGCQAYFYYTNSQNTYTFHDTSIGSNLSYSWSFGDGGTENDRVVVHTYSASGTYNVCVIISNTSGCLDTFCRSITVTVPAACQAYFNTSGTSQNVFTFNNYSQGTSLSSFWTFGDGDTSYQQTPTHTYTTAGAYTACLYISNTSGCLDTFCRTVNVTIPSSCQAYFNTTNSQNIYTFNNYSQGTGLSYSWDFGDGFTGTQQSPVHNYFSSGTYNACLVISNTSGCRDTFCRSITVSVTSCTAYFYYTTSQTTYTFQNYSTGDSLSYLWSFGDGDTSDLRAPVHTYATAGTYNTCLIISNSFCRDTFCRNITVTVPTSCNAAFTYSNQQNVYTFQNTSTGTYLTYAWTFGDGGSSSQQNPVHTYLSSGTYQVQLIISNTSGCRDTASTSITVTSTTSCHAAFSYTATGRTVAFANTSTGTNLVYLWRFGDGTTSSQASPTHQYPQYASYTACLFTSNGTGCYDSLCVNIALGTTAPCNANFTYTVSGNNVAFSNTSTNSTIYYWFFGDNTVSTQSSPTHNYSQAGSYYVCLLAINNATSCRDTFCTTINVTGTTACQAYFYYNQTTYTFTNYSQGNNLFYNWDFGDGGTDTVKNPVHTYLPGTYNACLVIFNTAGCVDTFCRSITIAGTTACNASFAYTNQQNYYAFQNTSTGSSLSNYWIFGDGNYSTQPNPTHAYSPGTYTACLIISNTATGCHDTTCTSITVASTTSCHASFSYTVSGSSVAFNNTSSNFTSSFWSFGDGVNSTQQNPSHTYSQSGTYQVCLTTIDTSGCTDNVCQNVLVSVTSHQYYCISGRVTKGTATNAAYPATVYLIYNDTSLGTLIAIRTTVTDQSGNYQFCTVPLGRYLVKAALNPTAPGYSNYVPTYFGNSLFWSYATELLVNHNFQQIDIWLIAGNNTGGPGFVGGSVSQGANKMSGLGDPIEGVQVMLLDEFDNPVQYIYSDSSGRWDFSNVAYGTYKVYAEVLGIPTYPYFVTIEPGNESADNISLIVESAQVISDVMPLNALINSIKVYPNPAHDVVNVELSFAGSDELNVIVTDIAGKKIIEEILYGVAGTQTFGINLSEVRSGVYLLSISGKVGAKTFKVVKY